MKTVIKISYFLSIIGLFNVIFLSNIYSSDCSSQGGREKILLLCLDGATWNVMLPMIKDGKLQNFSKLMEHGVYGNLICEPPFSPPSWASIITGKVEEKHGVSCFHDVRKVKAIWNILSEKGIRVGIIHWLNTYPAEKVNGFIVPHCFADEERKDAWYPNNLQKELENLSGVVEVPAWETVEGYKFWDAWDNNLIERAMHLIKKYDPQFVAVGFETTNPYQHRYWSAMQPEFFDITIEEVEEKGKLIEECYIKIDNFLSYFMENDYTIIFVSDHGFNRNDLRSGPRIIKYYSLNSDMQHINFLCNLMLYKIGLLNFIPLPPEWIEIGKASEEGIARRIDFSKTKAYFYNDIATNNKGIRINQRILAQGEYERLIEKLYELLKMATFGSGEKVFINVRKSHLRDKNSQLDIVFDLNPLFFKRERISFEVSEDTLHKIFKYLIDDNGRKLTKILLDNEEYDLGKFIDFSRTGEHEVDGVLILYGKYIKKGITIEGAKNIDITPTVLYLMGFLIGEDMDGRVLTEAVNSEFLRLNPVRYVKTCEEYRYPNAEEDNITLDEKTKEKLRSLGYVQ